MPQKLNSPSMIAAMKKAKDYDKLRKFVDSLPEEITKIRIQNIVRNLSRDHVDGLLYELEMKVYGVMDNLNEK